VSADSEDDPQLKSLRAVWLSMPDEDPPERGLAELMAAARVKAEQMTQPSLWQRISALLRRPPVLALATVLVLIGGAVFIGNRRDKMQAEPTVATERARDTTALPGTGSAPAVTAGEAQGNAAVGGAPVPTETPPALPEPSLAPAEQSLAKPEPKPPQKKTPPRRDPPRPVHKPSVTTTSTTTTESPSAPKDLPEAKKSETKLELDSKPTRGFEKGGAEGRDDKASTDSFAPEAEAPTVDATTSSGAPSRQSPPPSRAPQYVAQAKSAAARGDCAAARTLMKRVATEDPTTYRKALAADAALKKCVAAN
jgi:hypothetical protein